VLIQKQTGTANDRLFTPPPDRQTLRRSAPFPRSGGKPVRTVTMPLRRAWQVYRTEGLAPVVTRAFGVVLRCFLEYDTYYLYELSTENIRLLNEADFMPMVGDFALKIVSTNQEATVLEAEGFEFRSQVAGARERLEKGAIAFCVFVGRDLAHIGWVCLSQEAQDSLKEPPHKTDYLQHEAWWGGFWTDPRYRRKRLMAYGDIKRLEFLLDKGIVTSRYLITTGNIASQRSNVSLNARVPAEGRLLKVLWWRSWRETPLSPGQQSRLAGGDGAAGAL